jgi:hypothetical protein
MITGLYIQMPTEKLQRHLDSRRRYHAEKAEWYKTQVANLSAEVDARLDVSNNPTQSLRQSQMSHENKAAFFALLAENLIPDETYRLSQDDCILLDLRERFFG